MDTLVLPPGKQKDAAGEQLQMTLAGWPRLALALLAGTWLGATNQPLDDGWINHVSDRAIDDAAARYDAQADAILYLGRGEVLTASRPDPAIFHWGPFAQQLRRLSPIVSAIEGQHRDLVAEGLQLAQAGPSWFA